MKFNIFDPYLFLLNKVTLYCPPINHKRFKREFINRTWLRLAQLRPKKCYHSSGEMTPTTSKVVSDKSCLNLIWIISNPIQVYKLVRDYHLINNINMIFQFLYLIVLFHLFIKSIIHTVVAGSDRERIKYFNSVYYVHIAGVSNEPYIFNYFFLGISFLSLIIRCARFKNMIKMSLRNANEYRDLRVGQLNNSYLASFHLSLREWIELWTFIDNNIKYHTTNKCFSNSVHLRFNNSIQQKIATLCDRDAIFYFNPIDFEASYRGSVLCNYNERMKRYKRNHFALPMDRVSLSSLKEIIIVVALGSIGLILGYNLCFFSVLYLELRSEFESNYTPSIGELLYGAPKHFSNPKYLIRGIECIFMLTLHSVNIYDIASSLMDFHTITSRAHKIHQIFEKHIEFFRHQVYINNLNLIQLKLVQRNSQALIHIERITESNYFLFRKSYNLCLAYNRQIEKNISTIRLLYHEFLSAKKHHTEFLNIFILGGAICIAYTINVLVSHPFSAETSILIAALMSTILPIVALLVYCAKLERTVSLLRSPIH